MPTEIEIKLHVSSHEPLRAKLSGLGATSLGQFLETNYILDRPDGSLRRQGCGLRVREARNETDGRVTSTLTFKGPRAPGPVKSREELETVAGSGADLRRILARMGYVVILEYEKRRESWSVEDARVELDEAASLGLFVEIEGESEEAIRAVQSKLGLSSAIVEPRSYVSMLISHCAQAGICPPVVRFAVAT